MHPLATGYAYQTNQKNSGQNLMKGYISRERGTVVLSKNDTFPGTVT